MHGMLLRGKTTTFMSDTRDWCRQYHNVLGVGESQDAPVAIRFLAHPPAMPAASVGSVYLPTSDDVSKLQHVIINLFTSASKELKLQITREMEEAIYTSIANATASLPIPNCLPSTPPVCQGHKIDHQQSYMDEMWTTKVEQVGTDQHHKTQGN